MDILDATDEIRRVADGAVRLIEAVRASGSMDDIMLLLGHLRAVAHEVDEAFAEAKADLARGALGDPAFRRMYAAGSAHAMASALCESLAGDGNPAVRLAGAAGSVVLKEIDGSREAASVLDAMRVRLSGAA
jgi:hypothetical protein